MCISCLYSVGAILSVEISFIMDFKGMVEAAVMVSR